MGQLAFLSFPDVEIEAAFKNRKSNIRLADIIPVDRLISELNHVRTLVLSKEQLKFVEKQGIFKPEYREYLYQINRSNPLSEVRVEVVDGQFDVRTKGKWPNAILWETIVLAVINELYYEYKYPNLSYDEGLTRLANKIKILKKHPQIKFSDFGTRRRASRTWQALVVNKLRQALPNQFLGTSNVQLAMDYNITPIGTFAHEMPMVASGVWYDTDVELKASHGRVLDMWYELYDVKLSIALTDTFGTKFFFEDFVDRAPVWNGLRHDSGDPFEFGHKVLAYYASLGIDSKTKTIVFSDGLDLDIIIRLEAIFGKLIKCVFGWGTTLTNDIGYETLSIVMKAIRANGNELVKLSDNLNKATGSDATKSRYISVFGYDNQKREECVV
jgi:nicotinate phosphoribosyltransferase